jgi:GrpB-like predicted nucleotidyltransferase (UPF0157 family)
MGRARRAAQRLGGNRRRAVIVRVVPYDPAWSHHFELERGRVEAALGDVALALHHIGSTAIPGIQAKPIIDMLLEVSSLAELDRRTRRMESLGYEAKGEFGIAGRRYFRRDDERGVRTHQVHAFAVGSEDIVRHLVFRDYMIAHPQIARLYGELKGQLAARHPNDIGAYSQAKDGFVKEHQSKALLWHASRLTSSCSGP